MEARGGSKPIPKPALFRSSALKRQVSQVTITLGELETSRERLQAAGLVKNRFLANMSQWISASRIWMGTPSPEN